VAIYEYQCPSCEEHFEVSKSIADYARSEKCPKCATEGERRVSESSFVLKGDGWPGKALKVKGQMAHRRKKLGRKQKDHVAPPLKLTPNVGGEETGTWSEAQKLATSKGKDAESFTPLVAQEKRGER